MNPFNVHTSNTRRLTLVIGSLGPGGAERNLLRLAEALYERGHQVSVMTLNPHIKDFYPVPSGVKRVYPLAEVQTSPRWFDVSAQRRQNAALRQSLLSTAPDLVVSFIDTCNIKVLTALRDTEVPVIVSERTDWRVHKLNWRWNLLRRLMYPRAARVVSLARAPASAAINYWPRWRCVHIANPVPRPSGPRVQKDSASERKNVVAVGRLTHAKGLDLLLKAFSLTADLADWHLTIYGEGPDRASLEAQAAALGLSDRVHMPGITQDIFSPLKSADLFVFSSRYEAFGMALAEAMACGLPVVSFDCPSGPADIVRHGVDGLLVAPQDVQALATAMRSLMGDPDQRQRMGMQALQVIERFSPERIYGEWEKLLQEVMDETGARS